MESPIAWSLASLALNLGARHMYDNISPMQERVFASPMFQQLVMFSMFFLSSRDALTSVMLTLLFSIIMFGVMNERSRLNVIAHGHLPPQLVRTYTAKWQQRTEKSSFTS